MEKSNSQNVFPRPLRDERIESMLDMAQTMEVLMFATGGFGFAGHDENPRPIPQWTFHDLKMRYESSLQHAHQSGIRNIDDALWFGFLDSRQQAEPHEAVALSKEDLWWMAARLDTLLLSDGITHHYSTVLRVDRKNERIYFQDPWPDMFFLKEGLNVAGVRAKTEGGLNISKKEFMRVVTGLITLDTPELIEHYFTYRPEQWNNGEINLRFGLALLDVQKKRFTRTAAIYLQRALALAGEQDSPDLALLAAQKLFFALNHAILNERLFNKDPLFVKPYQDELERLEAHSGQDKLLAALDVEELCSLGSAAGYTKEFELSEKYLNLAVCKNNQHENARWLRTKVGIMQQNFEGVIADATVALCSNTENAEKVQHSREALDHRDRIGIEDNDAQTANLQHKRYEVLLTRATAYTALKHFDEARRDLKEIIAFKPQETQPFFALGVLEFETGNREVAEQWIQKAIQLEQQPGKRAEYENYLHEKLKLNKPRKIS